MGRLAKRYRTVNLPVEFVATDIVNMVGDPGPMQDAETERWQLFLDE